MRDGCFAPIGRAKTPSPRPSPADAGKGVPIPISTGGEGVKTRSPSRPAKKASRAEALLFFHGPITTGIPPPEIPFATTSR